ncbi:GAF domain-containing protein [Dolichospermum sp. UHCC 0259]|uniref:GAF domain-containing protein n=1 Tax=Dolichospermum sp. UHCC 0259 TaxID=2590010 RepID=UPI001EBBA268|nr:GAF domain-containing protein [Dolichospermum sp. UHCC 0259]MTJ46463.1 GAF domain-containing protein [Dolichospermum sp. UHCC 0259]
MTTLYQNPNEDAGNIFSTAQNEEKKKDNGNGSNYDSSSKSLIAQEFKIWRQRFQDVTTKMRQVGDLEKLLSVTVAEIKAKLVCDRVLIYQFTTDDIGTVLAESRSTGWTPAINETLAAIVFGVYTSADYLEPVIIDDISQIQVTPYQKQLLEKFQVRASLSLPIFVDSKVWGLLVVHSCGTPRQWQETETTLLSQIATEITYRVQGFKLQKELKQSSLAKQSAAKVITKILQQPDVEKIFQTTTQEVRQLLKCDRVGVYRFNEDWSGQFISESVGNNWVKVVTPGYQMVWEDTHLQDTKGGRYAKGESFVVNDTYKIGLAQCHIDILEQFEAKAYIISPVFSGEKLWGLLAAYQNTGAREWQDWEVSFLNQIGSQFGVAVSQGEYLGQVQKQNEQITQISKQEKALTKIINRVRQSSNIDDIFKIATQEMRQALRCDRVAVYQFLPDFSGKFVAESVSSGWNKLVNTDHKDIIEDTYLQETNGARFAKGETIAVNDIHKANITPCYLELLEQFEAKAYINVPIFFDDQLWGLLAAYQNSAPREWQSSEVSFLSQVSLQFSQAKTQIDYVQTLARAAEQEKAINRIVNRIRQSLDVETIFQTTTQEIRQALQCDRVAIYQFTPDWGGKFVHESVGVGWTQLVGPNIKTVLDDTYLQDTKGGRYAKGETFVVNDTYKIGLADCHIKILEQFEAKSYIIVPIFFGDKLWGLLGAYQNTGPREWKSSEVNFLNQIGLQFSLAKSQVDFVEKVQEQSVELAKLVEQEKTVNKIVNRIRQAANVEEIFKNTTQEVRQALKCDRVGVYQFHPDWSGTFIAESVGSGWTKIVTPEFQMVWPDTHLQETQGGRYAKGESFVVNDIYQVGHAQCHIEILEQIEVKAYMIVPIFFEDKLWGLLAAYQNTGIREWQESEVNFLTQIGLQFSLAKSQIDYIQKIQKQTAELAKVAEQEKAVNKIVGRIRQAVGVEDIFKTTTQEVRQALKCDRVGVYQFHPDWSGTFIAESVGSGWTKIVTPEFQMVWPDTHLQETQGGRYAKGESFVVNDIYQVGHAQCHIEILEQIEVKAYMIVPIFFEEKLWGLLAAYQNSASREWQPSEINFLTQIGLQFSLAKSQVDYLDRLRDQSAKIAQIVEQEKTFSKIVNQIRQSLTSGIDEIFKSTTQDIRQLFKCDRAAIYKFTSDWGGNFVAESVATGWVKLVTPELKTAFDDPCLQAMNGGDYKKGSKLIVSDIYQASFDTCYIELLEGFDAKAYAIVPILFGEKLWGLLAVYQNSSTRHWEESETNLLARIGDQLGLALQQTEFLQQLQTQSAKLSEAATREKAAKELLQQRSIQLLMAVKPALKGDLTVRAPITEDEIGTIADAYNGTLKALQQIVIQVQSSSQQVAETSTNSSTSLVGLTHLAEKQSDEITQALSDLQQMVNSTQAVVNNAQLVQIAVQQANKTVDSGDTAMNETVNAIQAIRETVAQTSKKIKRLSESSQKISKVVNLISSFATQTNVLALNAAIEATRAGEYGKGFAVVADEVRSLSRQSAAATIEIEKLVQEIQAETGEVAVAMETGIQQVVEGTNLVNDTRQNLNDIVSATAEISQLIERITEATQIQMQQSGTVTKSMNDVAEIANKTFGESQEIANVFQSLTGMAQDLLATASKFKVK